MWCVGMENGKEKEEGKVHGDDLGLIRRRDVRGTSVLNVTMVLSYAPSSRHETLLPRLPPRTPEMKPMSRNKYLSIKTAFCVSRHFFLEYGYLTNFNGVLLRPLVKLHIARCLFGRCCNLLKAS